MVTISRANRQDLPAVSYLLQQSGKMIIEDYHFNKRDIALQARDDSGQLVGFIWCGLMCNGKLGYIDKFAVDKNYWKRGVGKLILTALLRESTKRGVDRLFGHIRHDEYFNGAAIGALNIALASDSMTYTVVGGNVAHCIEELRKLEDKWVSSPQA